jgi:hypothetical protein
VFVYSLSAAQKIVDLLDYILYVRVSSVEKLQIARFGFLVGGPIRNKIILTVGSTVGTS